MYRLSPMLRPVNHMHGRQLDVNIAIAMKGKIVTVVERDQHEVDSNSNKKLTS